MKNVKMQELRSRRRPYFGQPYKMLIFLLYATGEGFERTVDPETGMLRVRVHWPTLRRMMSSSGHRMLAYMDFLQTRKYVTLLSRSGGFAVLTIPSPWALDGITPSAPGSDVEHD